MMVFDCGQQRRVRTCDRPGERDLRLYAGDTVDGELVLALEVAHLRGEVGVKDITGRGIGLAAVQVLQALPQPAHRRAAHPGRQRLHGRTRRTPQHHEITQPVTRQLADAHLLRAAELQARRVVTEGGEHHLVTRAAIVQQQDRRVVVEPQLPEGAALGDALQSLLRRLGARVGGARLVLRSPEAEELGERAVGVGLGLVLREQLGQVRRAGAAAAATGAAAGAGTFSAGTAATASPGELRSLCATAR